MRVMAIVKASKDSEAGKMPSDEMLAEMGKFNEQLAKAGILLDGTGLRPSKDGARVVFRGKERTVVDGPFPETKELIAGYWLLQVKDLAEAVEWMKRCPHPQPSEDSNIELRPLFELEDFEMSAATKELHDKVGEQIEKQTGKPIAKS